MATPSPPRRPRRTVLLTVVGGVVSFLGASATLAWCSVMGCADLQEPFRPQGRAATEARVEATREVAVAADGLTGGREVLAQVSLDACVDGESTWKRKDPFAHRCSVTTSRVLATGARDGAAAEGELLAVHDGLLDAGCRTAGPDGIPENLDALATPHVGGPRFPVTALPPSRYLCGGTRQVVVATTSSADPPPPEVLGEVFPGFADTVVSGGGYTDADVRRLVAAGVDLAVVVTVTQEYYQTDFWL